MNPAQALLIGILAGAVGPAALYFWCRHFVVKMAAEIRENGTCPVCQQVNAALLNSQHAHPSPVPSLVPCPWITEGESALCGKPGTHKIPDFLEFDRVDGDVLCLAHFEKLLHEENARIAEKIKGESAS